MVTIGPAWQPRSLEVLEVPTGPRLLDLLPRLQQALAGVGPALLPVPADHQAEAARLITGLAGGAALSALEDDQHDPTAFVVATSGSTGPPKGALLPVDALAAAADATRCALTCADWPHEHPRNGPPRPAIPAGSWLLTLPGHHIAGLQVLLRSVADHAEPVIMDTARPFTPQAFVDAVHRMPSGRRFVSLVPTQLHRLLADPEAMTALATFSAVLVGGAATPQAFLDDARRAAVTIVTTYGMSETCGGCVYNGVPLEHVTVGIDSDSEGRPGRVSITGPMVARGYRDLPHHPAFVRDPRDRHRTFLTDDLGLPDGPGIRIVGRIDDVIVTGGVKVDPAVVESVLVRVAGVADVVVTGVPDPEWGSVVVAVVVPGAAGDRPDLTTLRAAAGDAQGPAAAPKHLVVVDDLPLRGPGKPDRAAVRAIAVRELARQEPGS